MSILEGQFESSFQNAERAVKKIIDLVTSDHYFSAPNQRFFIDFVVRELLNNAVEYGNKNDIRKTVAYKLDNTMDYIEFSVRDQGDGFNLEEAIKADQDSGIVSVRNRGLLAAVKLNWNLSVHGGTITAWFHYRNNKEG